MIIAEKEKEKIRWKKEKEAEKIYMQQKYELHIKQKDEEVNKIKIENKQKEEEEMRKKLKKINEALEDVECGICLDTMVFPVTNSCGHTFCERCISNLKETSRNSNCPQCRAELNPEFKTNILVVKLIEKHIIAFSVEEKKGL